MHSTQVFCRRFYELSVHASYLSCDVLPWTVPKRLQICSLSWGHSKPKSQMCSIWLGFPGGAESKEPTCQWRRHRFNPWVRKIPWRGAWQPTPIFLPGESHGQWSLAGYMGLQRVAHDCSDVARGSIWSFQPLDLNLLLQEICSGRDSLPSIKWYSVDKECTNSVLQLGWSTAASAHDHSMWLRLPKT